jgi:hypothetical protein
MACVDLTNMWGNIFDDLNILVFANIFTLDVPDSHTRLQGIIKEKLSDNSHFITLQIDAQSPNLFYSNYITEAKKGHSITSPKQIMIQTHHR